jgi:hypothetical protein
MVSFSAPHASHPPHPPHASRPPHPPHASRKTWNEQARTSAFSFLSSGSGGGLSLLGSSSGAPLLAGEGSFSFGSSAAIGAAATSSSAASLISGLSSAFPFALPSGTSSGAAAFSFLSSGSGGGLSLLGSSSGAPLLAGEGSFSFGSSAAIGAAATSSSVASTHDDGPLSSVLHSKALRTKRNGKSNPPSQLGSHEKSLPEFATEDPPCSFCVVQSALLTPAKVREVPGMIRVGYENVLGTEHVKVHVAGMTGPHASKINGIYVSNSQSHNQAHCIHIAGATGPNAHNINGTYDAIDEMNRDHPIYIKRGDHQRCFHWQKETFLPGIWTVTEIKLGKPDKGKAILRFDGGLELSTSTSTCEILVENSKWMLQPDVRCTTGVGKIEGGLKKIDADVWLEYRADKFAICDSSDRHSDNGYIFCDVGFDFLSGNLNDFHLFGTLWLTHRLWYSRAKKRDNSSSACNSQNEFVHHPDVSIKCDNFPSFAGVFHISPTSESSLPAFIRNGPDPHVIEYSDEGALWLIKECSTNRVVATSCAVSSDFPVPILWSATDHASVLQLPLLCATRLLNQSNLSRASKSFFVPPMSISIVAANASLDAALFEGNYEFYDWKQYPNKDSARFLYHNAESTYQFVFDITSLRIDFAGLAVDGEILFIHRAPNSQVQEFTILSSFLTDDPNFSMDIFRNPLADGDAPAFRILSRRCVKQSLPKAVSQPRLMPMFNSPPCVNFVKSKMQEANFDARSFWRHTLAQMSGHAEATDFTSLHRTIVSCKSSRSFLKH